ncbi:MAG TPA: 50S ribosomal protein L6, partial [candidate division Zixibacteria bacterium]
MSRTGKKPIPIPNGVKVEIKDNLVSVNGPKGELKRAIHPSLSLELDKD